MSWEPIQASQEYPTAGSYTFNVPTQAKQLLIEATGAGGGGSSGDAIATEYVPGSLWALRTVGTTLQMNALAFKNDMYLLGGTANVVLTLAATNQKGVIINIATFANVNQTTPLGKVAAASGDSTAPSVAVTSVADDVVYDVLLY